MSDFKVVSASVLYWAAVLGSAGIMAAGLLVIVGIIK